ncbi:AAA family ATPase [Lactobacillus delbrueckii subsp. bulgaricus]|uniref:AAA family ATPase n=2 Tax=Lactobacillus delbrueckii TaxID=1584 RepID=UPI00155ED51F|nr:ATP-binding protein [Lactobacillus delbrueckii]NRD07293.1 AAA family ATPase [Lactobacillus delbrueckii subsp. bulgaricus]
MRPKTKMWIKSLTIHDYRAFQREFNIELSPNLTAIAGENGVGKSTLLAVLTNVGEVKKYKTLAGTPFRGEFSNIIMFDPKFDTVGEKATVEFEDIPDSPDQYRVSKRISFRASKHTGKRKKEKYKKSNVNKGLYSKKVIQETYIRYRLIPIKTKERNSESKVQFPTYYLGLSRLDPLGEFDTAKSKSIPPEWRTKIEKIHSEILEEKIEQIEAIANLDVGTRHNKADIATSYYGYESNSSGQDNTGQIIEAVLSFEKLKEEMQSNSEYFVGGILAIDEIESTLHPAAQNRLIDWLLKESKKLCIQIVFTTHSLTLLEHLSSLKENKKEDGIKINYLKGSNSAPGTITCYENPKKAFYRYNLHETYSKKNTEPIVKIFTEDEVARWELKEIIDYLNLDLPKIEMIDCNLSWNVMVSLIQADPVDFDNFIFILDADMNPDKEDSELCKYMKSKGLYNFKVNTQDGNLLTFPGEKAVEQELWTYVNSQPAGSELFEDVYLAHHGITTPEMIKKMNTIDVNDRGTSKPITVGNNSKMDDYKMWFKKHCMYRNAFLKFWMESNSADIKKFGGLLNSMVNRIYRNIKSLNTDFF